MHVQRVSSEQAKARLMVMSGQLKSVRSDIGQTRSFLRKSGSKELAKRLAQKRLAILKVHEKFLLQRIALLQKGQDVQAVPKLNPASMPIRRIVLQLPGVWSVPKPALIGRVARIIALRLGRLRNETILAHRIRRRALLQRAIARLVILKEAQPQVDADALATAAADVTLVEDTQAITAEVQAGGVTPDPAADAMLPVVEASEAEVAQAEAEAGVVVDSVASAADPSSVTAPNALVSSDSGAAFSPSVVSDVVITPAIDAAIAISSSVPSAMATVDAAISAASSAADASPIMVTALEDEFGDEGEESSDFSEEEESPKLFGLPRWAVLVGAAVAGGFLAKRSGLI